MYDYLETFGQTLRRLRKVIGLKQITFKKIHFTESHISLIESDKRQLTAGQRTQLITFISKKADFDVDVDREARTVQEKIVNILYENWDYILRDDGPLNESERVLRKYNMYDELIKLYRAKADLYIDKRQSKAALTYLMKAMYACQNSKVSEKEILLTAADCFNDLGDHAAAEFIVLAVSAHYGEETDAH